MGTARILCFYGPDGAGKTSLASAYYSSLSGRGVKARLSWLRGTHLFLSPLARLLSKTSAFRGSCNPYYGICVPRSLAPLWLLLEIVAAILLHIARYRLPSLLGYRVVGDRCIVDFIAWIYATLGVVECCAFLKDFLVREATRIDLVFVTAEPSTLKKRRGFEAEHIDRFYRIYVVLSGALKPAAVVVTG